MPASNSKKEKNRGLRLLLNALTLLICEPVRHQCERDHVHIGYFAEALNIMTRQARSSMSDNHYRLCPSIRLHGAHFLVSGTLDSLLYSPFVLHMPFCDIYLPSKIAPHPYQVVT